MNPGRPAIPEDFHRRLQNIENKLDDGLFVRRDIFELVNRQVRDDYEHIVIELASIQADMKRDRETRENDRKGLRNLILAALFSAAGSVVVSLIVYGATRAA